MIRSLRGRALLSAAAAASVLLTGCAGSGGTPAGELPGADASGDVGTDVSGTVRVLMEEVPDTTVVQDLLDEFNEVYPNVDVQIETSVYDQMRDRLVASFQAPEPTYDLAVIDNPWLVDFGQAGFLQPLDSRIDSTPDYDYDDFFAPLADIGTLEENRFSVPFYNYAMGLVYRSDVLEQAGLAAPTTLDELVSTAQTLNAPPRAGIALTPQRGYKIFEEWGNWLFSAGGSIYDDEGRPTLDTPEAERALNAYIEAYSTAAPDNSLSWAFDESLRAMSSDGAAMTVSYNWTLPSLNDPEGTSGPLAGSFALAPMPGGQQVLGLWGWGIPANSATPDAAWAFVSWLTSPEVEAERVILGGAPVRRSAVEDPRVAEEGFGAEYYATLAEILANASPLTEGASGEELIQAVGTELNAAVAGLKPVPQALEDAQAQAESILEQ